MFDYVLINAKVINEGSIMEKDIAIKEGRIARIDQNLGSLPAKSIMDLQGKYLMPGMIDDQVHFRDPGLTYKGDIYTESKAAVAGGITSFMDMPNTIPNCLTQEILEEKYQHASDKSLANYSFYMGASNDNLAEIVKTDPKNICGIKVFMGSSTGNMLVDNEQTLTNIFSKCPILIATHCEDEATVRKNLAEYKEKYGDDIPMEFHPVIRSEEACYFH